MSTFDRISGQWKHELIRVISGGMASGIREDIFVSDEIPHEMLPVDIRLPEVQAYNVVEVQMEVDDVGCSSLYVPLAMHGGTNLPHRAQLECSSLNVSLAMHGGTNLPHPAQVECSRETAGNRMHGAFMKVCMSVQMEPELEYEDNYSQDYDNLYVEGCLFDEARTASNDMWNFLVNCFCSSSSRGAGTVAAFKYEVEERVMVVLFREHFACIKVKSDVEDGETYARIRADLVPLLQHDALQQFFHLNSFEEVYCQWVERWDVHASLPLGRQMQNASMFAMSQHGRNLPEHLMQYHILQHLIPSTITTRQLMDLLIQQTEFLQVPAPPPPPQW